MRMGASYGLTVRRGNLRSDGWGGTIGPDERLSHEVGIHFGHGLHRGGLDFVIDNGATGLT